MKIKLGIPKKFLKKKYKIVIILYRNRSLCILCSLSKQAKMNMRKKLLLIQVF